MGIADINIPCFGIVSVSLPISYSSILIRLSNAIFLAKFIATKGELKILVFCVTKQKIYPKTIVKMYYVFS